MAPITPDPASFRDPSGFVFEHDGVLLRAIHESYREDFAHLVSSGLYERLVSEGLLVPHREVEFPELDAPFVKVIAPERVEFVSYPYEWCFAQWKDAAVATLRIQQVAFENGMTLKDASAFNIQFHRGRPLLIDTLSFARYREGQAWEAYAQFCRHFLAPLALMAYRDARLGRLLQLSVDGVDLSLAGALLPLRTRLRPGLLTHIHLHAAAQRRYAAGGGAGTASRSISRNGLRGLIDNLESTVAALNVPSRRTEWGDYYEGNTNYSAEAESSKKEMVARFLAEAGGRVVWDLGANTGVYSRIASGMGRHVLSFDIDPEAVERNYRQVRSAKETNLLPLLLDLANPSPGIGWMGRERRSLFERRSADVVMALALIHHLAIGNNVPLARTAAMFAELADRLVVEFVPKEDSQVKRLLASRRDIFPDYDIAGFERAFATHFDVVRREPIRGSVRILYSMRRRRA